MGASWAQAYAPNPCRPPTQDPLEQYGISEEARFQLSGLKA